MKKMVTTIGKKAQIFWKTEKHCKQQNLQEHEATPGSSLKDDINPFYSSFQSKNKKEKKTLVNPF